MSSMYPSAHGGFANVWTWFRAANTIIEVLRVRVNLLQHVCTACKLSTPSSTPKV